MGAGLQGQPNGYEPSDVYNVKHKPKRQQPVAMMSPSSAQRLKSDEQEMQKKRQGMKMGQRHPAKNVVAYSPISSVLTQKNGGPGIQGAPEKEVPQFSEESVAGGGQFKGQVFKLATGNGSKS